MEILVTFISTRNERRKSNKKYVFEVAYEIPSTSRYGAKVFARKKADEMGRCSVVEVKVISEYEAEMIRLAEELGI